MQVYCSQGQYNGSLHRDDYIRQKGFFGDGCAGPLTMFDEWCLTNADVVVHTCGTVTMWLLLLLLRPTFSAFLEQFEPIARSGYTKTSQLDDIRRKAKTMYKKFVLYIWGKDFVFEAEQSICEADRCKRFAGPLLPQLSELIVCGVADCHRLVHKQCAITCNNHTIFCTKACYWTVYCDYGKRKGHTGDPKQEWNWPDCKNGLHLCCGTEGFCCLECQTPVADNGEIGI